MNVKYSKIIYTLLIAIACYNANGESLKKCTESICYSEINQMPQVKLQEIDGIYFTHNPVKGLSVGIKSGGKSINVIWELPIDIAQKILTCFGNCNGINLESSHSCYSIVELIKLLARYSNQYKARNEINSPITVVIKMGAIEKFFDLCQRAMGEQDNVFDQDFIEQLSQIDKDFKQDIYNTKDVQLAIKHMIYSFAKEFNNLINQYPQRLNEYQAATSYIFPPYYHNYQEQMNSSLGVNSDGCMNIYLDQENLGELFQYIDTDKLFSLVFDETEHCEAIQQKMLCVAMLKCMHDMHKNNKWHGKTPISACISLGVLQNIQSTLNGDKATFVATLTSLDLVKDHEKLIEWLAKIKLRLDSREYLSEKSLQIDTGNNVDKDYEPIPEVQFLPLQVCYKSTQIAKDFQAGFSETSAEFRKLIDILK